MDVAILPALQMLPSRMDSPEARAMLLAIGLQESGFEHRRQIVGPAASYWQFERSGGVTGVLAHPSTAKLARECCERLDINPDPIAVYEAIVYHDVLACVLGRLLLWTSPLALPHEHEANAGWTLYISTWRPGKPHPEQWNDNYWLAWNMVRP
jgi:hypothetical protein